MVKQNNVLVYHGKHGDEYWIVDTPGRVVGAVKALFKLLDDMGCYEESGNQRFNRLLAEARSENLPCIQAILESRNGYEYESWDLVRAEIVE
jgi:hypothetical protein